MAIHMKSFMAGPVAVALHTSTPPSKAEWSEWMRLVRTIPLEQLHILVFTDGGAPNTVQRGEFTDHLAGRAAPIAVVSSTLVVRSIVTAISWFNPQIKVFAPADASSAMQFVNIAPPQQADFLRGVADAAAALEGGVPRALKQGAAAVQR
jgi:hypothetical protein